MKRIYVASQNPETREWVPVAELREVTDGYELRYTKGALRLPGFSGLSRMQALEEVYYSRALFPFFRNRLIPKSRPEYRDYLRWLGLETLPSTPLDMLAVTGGVRATDSYELVTPPKVMGAFLELDFFPRGLRYLPRHAIDALMEQSEGSDVFLMRDIQNKKDPNALAIRTDRPHAIFIGYVPRYYCLGLSRLMENSSFPVECKIKRVSQDAPLDLKLLLTVKGAMPDKFDLLSDVTDFQALSATETKARSKDILSRTDLNIPD